MERISDLGADFEAFIDEAVQAGDYASRDEVLRGSLRLLQERYEARHNFEHQIASSIEDAEAGRSTDADEVFDRLERKYRAMIDARPAV